MPQGGFHSLLHFYGLDEGKLKRRPGDYILEGPGGPNPQKLPPNNKDREKLENQQSDRP